MPSCVVVGGRGARHHVERGLRHVRVRMPRRLEVAVELPFHRRDVDDVLVALRRAQHQRLQPRVEDERRDGVDELHLEQLDRRAPRRAAAARSCARAGRPAADPDRAALRGRDRCCAASSSGSSGTCDSSAECVSPSLEPRDAPLARLLGQHVVRRAVLRSAPSSSRTCSGIVVQRRRLALHHVRVELGRTAHGLAGVVDDEVEPVARRRAARGRTPRRSACGADRARRSRAGRAHSPKSGSRA